jgi:hypothetical protein
LRRKARFPIVRRDMATHLPVIAFYVRLLSMGVIRDFHTW